ncbi:unnamed protein product [Leuciscus chuanchicus]
MSPDDMSEASVLSRTIMAHSSAQSQMQTTNSPPSLRTKVMYFSPAITLHSSCWGPFLRDERRIEFKLLQKSLQAQFFLLYSITCSKKRIRLPSASLQATNQLKVTACFSGHGESQTTGLKPVPDVTCDVYDEKTQTKTTSKEELTSRY